MSLLNPSPQPGQSSSQTTIRPVGAPIAGGPLPAGMWGSANRAYVREVQPDQLVENRLTGLISDDSAYIQQARQQAMRQAASRGLGNSSMAAGAAQAAAIQSALPIATADAQTAFQTATQNQADLNAQQMALERNATSLEGARIGAGASIQSAQIGADAALQRQRENLAYSGEQAALQRAFQANQANMDHLRQLGVMEAGFGFDIGRTVLGGDVTLRNSMMLNQQGLQNQMTLADQANYFNQQNMLAETMIGLVSAGYGATLQNNSLIMQNILSDPSYFQDPEATTGLVNFFSNLFNPQNPMAIGNEVVGSLSQIFGRRGI